MLTINQIRNFYPGFGADAQTSIHILKEYVELMVLDFLSGSKYVGKLCFIGGTSLRLIKGIDRFSEDLDFDCKNFSEEVFQEMTDDVVRFLQRNGLPATPKEKESDRLTAYRRTITFPEYLYSLGLASEAERNRKFILKIEAQDQGVPYTKETALISMDGFHFSIPVPSVNTLCSMKLSAILDRAKGRDFYDSLFLMQMSRPDYAFLKTKNGIANAAALREAMSRKLAATDLNMKARDFEYLIFNKARASVVLDYGTLFDAWLENQ